MVAVVQQFSKATATTLYRAILREHRRKLPAAMRLVGDDYVRNEFKLHKVTTSAEHLGMFFTGWNSYLDNLRAHQTGKTSKLGRNLTKEERRQLSEEQAEKVALQKDEIKGTFK